MDIKVTFTQTLEDDGADKVFTLEEKNVGEYVADYLTFWVSAMNMIGFSYIEEISANNGTHSSDDWRG